MSIALMTLAFKAALPTTQKFVLVALCDSANDQGECYPSVPTLAEKCSMGVRTVQEAIVALENAGHLRREFRNGRSTVYWVSPHVSAVHGEHHYVYRVTDAATGDFYIGLRTCLGNPASDSYMGSGLELQGRDMSGFTKEVLGEFATRAEAAAAEHAYVDASIGLGGCLNLRRPPVPTPAPAAPRSSRTPQIAHPTPADCAPPPPQQPHPTPAAAAPITVNEPSEEPSGKRKKKEPPPSIDVFVLVDAGFDEQTAEDFIDHKQRMKSPLSQRAWRDHLREAEKAGWSPIDAAEKVMAKNWKGFEAKYVANEARPGAGPPVSKQLALEQRNRAVIDEYLREANEAH